MKQLKLLFVIMCITIFTLTNCNFTTIFEDPKAIIGEANQSKIEVSKKLIDCFKEKNSEGIINLLCERTQKIDDINEQISLAINFIDGKIISYNEEIENGYEGNSISNGDFTTFDNSWTINDVKTDTGKTYTIDCHMFVLDPDKSLEGVSNFIITNKKNKEQQVGYKWDAYDYDVAALAKKAILAISDGNIDKLKSLFCTKSLESADIENQMKESFNFFEGKATFGKNKETGTYDGNHDFDTKINDEVKIKNYKPSSIFISAFIENIETDIGKTYEMELSAYLKNEETNSHKGISQIVIKYGNDKYIIGENIK